MLDLRTLSQEGIANLPPHILAELERAITPKWTKYIPTRPTPKQSAFLLLNGNEAFYGGAAGGGKPIFVKTAIYCKNKGWVTMADIEVGDEVFDDLGKPTPVIWTSEVFQEPCYKITFNKGAEEVIAGESHLWTVERRRSDSKRVTETVTTRKIFERFQANNSSKNVQSLFNIPVIPSLQFPEKQLVVDPYVFGVWLGDGNKQNGMLHCVDREIRDEFRALDYDVYFTDSSLMHDRTDLHVGGRLHHWMSARLVRELRELGFLGQANMMDKHIPEAYMTASPGQRLALLQGIMDTDGGAVDRSTGDCELTFANENLAYQCEELIRGLGIKVNAKYSVDIRENDPRYPRGIYHRWRLNWTTATPMFRLKRKLEKQATIDKPTFKRHFITNIEPCETVDVRCIQVANASKMFLITRSLIPTHNSEALLMAALQYVDVPGYSAILFRKTFVDLSLPGALIDRLRGWMMPFEGEVRWVDREKTWYFPSGATVSFGYLENDKDKYKYQSAEFQFIAFDELTQIEENSYKYLFSRLRRLKDMPVPLRVRAASNPGGAGHEWVKQRFITEGPANNRIFISAKLEDNPHLDIDSYDNSLKELDPVTRAQLREGNWDVLHAGSIFARQWFQVVDVYPHDLRRVRFWDLASSARKVSGRQPDYTAGVLMGEKDGFYYILNVIRVQKTPYDVEKIIQNTAMLDGHETAIYMEQEPGATGISTIDHYAREVLKGYAFRGVRTTGSKLLRANPVSAAAEQGRIFIVRGAWATDFLDELEAFPTGVNDDQVDALSGAFSELPRFNFTSVPESLSSGPSYWRREM